MRKIRSFFERIEFLRGETKIYPWLESMGMSRGTVSALKSGGFLSADNLAIVSRAENVNLNWLVAGEGAPYRVSAFADALSAAKHLRALGDERWVLVAQVIINDAASTAVVLQNPGSYRVGETEYLYTIVETVVCPLALPVYAALDAIPADQRVQYKATAAQAQGLINGWQTPEDFFSQIKPGLSLVREPDAAYVVLPGGKTLTGAQLDEWQQINGRLERLSPDQKSRIMGYLDSIETQ